MLNLNVLQWINPVFPRQNLESILTNECCYFANGTLIEIMIVRDSDDNNDAV